MFRVIVFLLLEPVKRVLSALLYLPLAFPLRRALREPEDLRPGFLYRSRFLPLWLMLDDSIRMETGEDCARQDSKYPSWVLACGWTWLRCYWWSAIRNSFVNFNNYAAYRLGAFQQVEAAFGASSFADIRARRAGWRVERRRFSGGVRLYCEFYLLRRWFQIGWLTGESPRFEIDLFKDK